ncbi:9855_t:CDS:2 [Funneliformis caledonium]|uniref:9855_t:CDS:1 n=2 Tax=Funneliformis TaxID=1117308 RepID=A0A9N9B3Q2_9GLOM|nr:9855_t:CDS:2 [Funneliformis caledonium]CAG8577504.1 8870_t:CDS:2 [Funneliformis mosseae]
MIVPSLPHECVEHILYFVKQNNRGLYSCLLVNRIWCRITIPLLWSNPFEREIKLTSQKYLFLNNYFINLNEEENSALIELEKGIPSYRRPIFDYIKYLEIEDFDIQFPSILYPDNAMNYVGAIIKNQNNIKSLKINLPRNWALPFQRNSLRNLNLLDLTNFKIHLNDILSSLPNNQLTELYFKNCKLNIDADSLSIKQVPICSLQITDDEGFEKQYLIIQMAGKYLKKLHLNSLNVETVKTMINYCPNIIDFTLDRLIKRDIPLLFGILDNLKLQKISLSLIYDSSYELNSSVIFDSLASHLPSTLTKLYLEGSNYTANEIYNFLGNYSGSLTYLIIYDKFLFRNPKEKLQVFFNFMSNNYSLKVFGVEFKEKLYDVYSIQDLNNFGHSFIKRENSICNDINSFRHFKVFRKEKGIYGIYMISTSELHNFIEYEHYSLTLNE